MTAASLVAIGGSAGSLDALRDLLPQLPGHTSARLAIVMHLSPTYPSMLAHILGGYTWLPVREALDKMPLEPGTIVIAPPDYHLLVEPDGTGALSRDAPHLFSRPAIDPLFESAARAYGARAIGVLLSGANEDGAEGLATIRAAGGRVAVQDPASASSPEMPTAALAACDPDLVGSPLAIGRWLANLLVPESQ